jgi:hypothetical protein
MRIKCEKCGNEERFENRGESLPRCCYHGREGIIEVYNFKISIEKY